MLGAWKLYKFVRAEGPQFSVPQVCLVVCLIVSVGKLNFYLKIPERFVYMIDPIFTKKIWPYPVANVLVSLSFPISLISNLFITFYCKQFILNDVLLGHEKMQQTKTVVLKHLEKARIPFGIICAIMIVLEITSSTLRGYWFYNQAIQALNGGLYAVITFCVALFFEIVGIRILWRISKSATATNQKGGRRKLFLNKVFILFFFSAHF